MSFAIGTILGREYNAAHADHIHVEPPLKFTGTPPLTNPGMSAGIKLIYAALTEEFGHGEYFLDKNGRYVGNKPGVYWTHMGGYNRRYIGTGTTWSQHSWWNALDIGPYVGTAQDKFYNFLTGVVEEVDMAILKDWEQVRLQNMLKHLLDMNSDETFVKYIVPDIRKGIITLDELEAALEDVTSATTVDQFARSLAAKANARLDAIKGAI